MSRDTKSASAEKTTWFQKLRLPKLPIPGFVKRPVVKLFRWVARQDRRVRVGWVAVFWAVIFVGVLAHVNADTEKGKGHFKADISHNKVTKRR